MREDTLSTNYTDIVQQRPKSGAQDNIDLKDNWFTPDLEEDTIDTPSHEPIVSPENNNSMLKSLQSILHLKASTDSEGAYVSEVIKHTDYEGVLST